MKEAGSTSLAMEGDKPKHGWLVETEGRKELWMSFSEAEYPDIEKVPFLLSPDSTDQSCSGPLRGDLEAGGL